MSRRTARCMTRVERLPEELRLPLLLHYMEGYKPAEIAGALGQSLAAVDQSAVSQESRQADARGGGSMKNGKMPSEREFQAMYPKDDAFDCAVRATLDALPDDSPNRMCVKRKMSGAGGSGDSGLGAGLRGGCGGAGRFWKTGGANRQQRLFGIVSCAG